MGFEHSQAQAGPIYGADQSSFGAVDASQQYYQVLNLVAFRHRHFILFQEVSNHRMCCFTCSIIFTF